MRVRESAIKRDHRPELQPELGNQVEWCQMASRYFGYFGFYLLSVCVKVRVYTSMSVCAHVCVRCICESVYLCVYVSLCICGREGSQEPTYGFPAFANHPASCRRGNSDVGLQLHLFFGIKEVFFFQFPKDPSLGLQTRPVPEKKLVTGSAAVHTSFCQC